MYERALQVRTAAAPNCDSEFDISLGDVIVIRR